jgi:hypothetical protein
MKEVHKEGNCPRPLVRGNERKFLYRFENGRLRECARRPMMSTAKSGNTDPAFRFA